jgi:hypothetical protein
MRRGWSGFSRRLAGCSPVCVAVGISQEVDEGAQFVPSAKLQTKVIVPSFEYNKLILFVYKLATAINIYIKNY